MRAAGKRSEKKAYSVSTFTKISGFRRVVICRNCGKRMLLEKDANYCEKCEKAFKEQ